MVLEWHSGMDWVASSLLARVKLLARWKITPHKIIQVSCFKVLPIEYIEVHKSCVL
jgi:hypothetical protein